MTEIQIVCVRRTDPPIPFADGSRAIALFGLVCGPVHVHAIRLVTYPDGVTRLRFAASGKIGRVHISEPDEQEIVQAVLAALNERRAANRARRKTTSAKRRIPQMENKTNEPAGHPRKA